MMFFKNMTQIDKITSASYELQQKITEDFGSFESFKSQFMAAAAVVEASGWCILAWVPDFKKLEILQCEKHQNLTLWGCKPLLVLDMWCILITCNIKPKNQIIFLHFGI